MAAFGLSDFERQAEAFLRARAHREYLFQAGVRPGRQLRSLYAEDFPEVTSTDFYLDLQAVSDAQPRQLQKLSELLASAYVEGNTVDLAGRAGGLEARTTLSFEDQDLPWREAPVRCRTVAEVPRRHELAEIWRASTRAEFIPLLERWHESLRQAVRPLGANDWLSFWAGARGLDLAASTKLAETILRLSGDVYAHALGVYFGQLELPLDDAWTADAGWAFRAPRFDAVFSPRNRMPVLVRAMRDLGIELESQTEIKLEAAAGGESHVVPVSVPDDARVLLRSSGGWSDYAASLRAIGTAQHLAHTDRTLPLWQRELGDETPTLGSGLLFESLVRDRGWLFSRLDYAASDDFRVIAHIAWLYRVRKLAVLSMYEQRLWAAEPGSALAADFEESLSGALHVRHFPDTYLLPLRNAPWSTLGATVRLRAELFAAHLRLFLKREFDEEWWRSGRAATFISGELWRTGRRHTADELLGFMGFEGFDPAILWAEIADVLAPL